MQVHVVLAYMSDLAELPAAGTQRTRGHRQGNWQTLDHPEWPLRNIETKYSLQTQHNTTRITQNNT